MNMLIEKMKNHKKQYHPILIKEFKRTFPIYFLGILVNGLQATFHFIIPFIIGQILDMVLSESSSQEEIFSKVYLLIFVSFLAFFPRALYRKLFFTRARISDTYLRKQAIQHLQYVKPEYYEREDKGTFLAYISKELLVIRKFLGNFFFQIGKLFYNPLVILIVIAVKYSWQISLALLPILVIMPIFIFRKYGELNEKIEQARKVDIELFKVAEQNTSGFSLIKLYNEQKNQMKKFNTLNEERKKADYRIGVTKNKISNLVNIMYAACYIVLFGLGLVFIKNHQLTVGALTALTTCMAFILSEITSSIQPLIEGIAYFKQSTNRYQYFFSLEPYQTDGRKLGEIETITLKNLSYSYNGMHKVLEDINLEIYKNEKIGIIGQIGSGKTTLMNLLSGLLEVENHQIDINGIDINEYARDEIFQKIGYATQKAIILDDSIENNINITKDEKIDVEELSKLSQLYEDVSKMKNQFETVIGERGSRLSGGQKQRVQIARSLSCIRDVNLFDDTLSALDAETEEKVLDSMIRETEGHILIVVSNKVSNMEKLDRIYLLVEGKIIAQGTHEELLKNNKLYQELYQYEREGKVI